jgi:hypothetical protein
MLSIFAIDPQVCQSLEWFRYCVEHCHPERGRAIADLPPGQWCTEALSVIDQCIGDGTFGQIKGHSIKRRLAKIRDRLVHRPGTDWDYLESLWLKNTENEHRRDPFAAIVSPEYEGADDTERKYHPDELDEHVAAWNTPSGMRIPRSPQEFSRAVLPLLVVAKQIHFLDRFFTIDAGNRYTRNYQQIIRDLASSRRNDFPTFTIHCCPNDDVDIRYFEDEFKRLYEKVIPTGKSVTCVVWQVPGEMAAGAHPFHNRYVLTDLCGIMVGYGTDSAKETTDAHDTLQILARDLSHQLLRHSRKRTHPLLAVRKEIIATGV